MVSLSPMEMTDSGMKMPFKKGRISVYCGTYLKETYI